MRTPQDAAPGIAVDARGMAPAAALRTRPLYWSVRRELWENRSVTIAPLAVTAFVLFGSLIGLIGLPRRIESLPAGDAAARHLAVVKPFSLAPAPIMLAAFLVGVFYALEALYGERRDRSILFWKSLPVSDRTAVLSKATIPLVVLPLMAFVLSVATVIVLLPAGSAVLMANGLSPATVWTEYGVFQEPLVMLYGLTVHALWFAPIYCWLLLVSAWARRTPVLWAVVPLLAVSVLERMAFNTSHFAALLGYRVTGAMKEAFAFGSQGRIIEGVDQLTPGRFLTSPGLWIGLAFAAGCLAAAVRLRRLREPI